jgi:hypothetical protein
MEKIDFKDYPDTTTPINAENLNTIQDNAEISINEVDTKNTNLKNQVANGWYEIDPTSVLTFSSWDASVYTGVVSTNIDLTSVLSVGMKIKLTQNGVVKYGFITAITSSEITLFMGTDYILEDIAISDMCYSILKAPFGFPINPDKWTIIITDIANRHQSSPVNNTWYNIGGLSILVPVGSWKLSYRAQTEHVRATAGYPSIYCALSTSASSVSNFLYQSQGFFFSASICSLILQHEFIVNLTTPTTYYLIAKTDQKDCTTLSFRGALTGTIMKAVCNYL